MTVDELRSSMLKDIESDNFTMQAVFDRHIREIERLKEQGYKYKSMQSLLGLEAISYSHYVNLLHRARQKTQPIQNQGGIKKAPHATQTEIVTSAKDNNPTPTQLKESLDDWLMETGIDISQRLAEKLEANGLDTREVKKLNLNTASKITKYLATLESQSKYE